MFVPRRGCHVHVVPEHPQGSCGEKGPVSQASPWASPLSSLPHPCFLCSDSGCHGRIQDLKPTWLRFAGQCSPWLVPSDPDTVMAVVSATRLFPGEETLL